MQLWKKTASPWFAGGAGEGGGALERELAGGDVHLVPVVNTHSLLSATSRQ
jgi:hypothetical protein